jgi:hypothetical protein
MKTKITHLATLLLANGSRSGGQTLSPINFRSAISFVSTLVGLWPEAAPLARESAKCHPTYIKLCKRGWIGRIEMAVILTSNGAFSARHNTRLKN